MLGQIRRYVPKDLNLYDTSGSLLLEEVLGICAIMVLGCVLCLILALLECTCRIYLKVSAVFLTMVLILWKYLWKGLIWFLTINSTILFNFIFSAKTSEIRCESFTMISSNVSWFLSNDFCRNTSNEGQWRRILLQEGEYRMIELLCRFVNFQRKGFLFLRRIIKYMYIH